MSELNENLLPIDINSIIYDQNQIKMNYDKFKKNLLDIRDKSIIQSIYRSNYLLNKLETNTFNEFFQLIDLDLSHNILTCLPRGVFDQLFNLQIVNLSHNLISELEDSLFRNNDRLRIINLSNNLITEINGRVFDNLNSLRKLDFSHNNIEKLSEKYMNSQSLQELNLSFNQINDIKMFSFWVASNLTDLQLNNNRISVLDESMFQTITNIENLNFSNNFVQKLHKKTFANLYNLKKADFSNNYLISCGNCFENKPMLIELNLLDNQINNFHKRYFSISENIRTLKLTLNDLHKLERLTDFMLLENFELHVKAKEIFILNYHALPWLNALTIQRLYMVIRRGKFNVVEEISNFFNLEFLYIEFLEPSDQTNVFDIGFHINKMPKFQHLALININKLIIIRDCNIKHNNLTYLDLTGIENESIDFLQNNFIMLEHLNLSFSNVESISQDLMSTLPHLKYLIMNSTKISVIQDNVFQYNVQLEVIEFRDCQIHTIGENSFRNLNNLKKIDIRGNTQLRITQGLLNGIPKSTTVYYD